MRVAALDLGSNTSLLLIADVEGDQLQRVLHDQTTITRLGQGVHANREFHPDALKRMHACLSEYAATIQKFKCERVLAVATSAARDVKNGHELIEMGLSLGIPIHIISGDLEARLTFRGALCDRKNVEGIAVIDVGGGSTEVIRQHQGKIAGKSVDVGSVRLTELFVKSDPITSGEMKSVREYASVAFQRAGLVTDGIREVVAVAGTPTTLAGIDQKIPFVEEKIHGYKLKLSLIQMWIEKMARMKLSEREALPGMQPKRADVIIPGSIILSTAIEHLGQEQVTVSIRGVRYGAALAWKEFEV